MIRSDYILKMIAQLAVALRQVLKLRASKRDDDALREIDLTLQKLCGLNSHLVNALSEDSLAQTLRAGAALDIGKALVIAEMLHEEANMATRRAASGGIGRRCGSTRRRCSNVKRAVASPARVWTRSQSASEFGYTCGSADRLIRYHEGSRVTSWQPGM